MSHSDFVAQMDAAAREAAPPCPHGVKEWAPEAHVWLCPDGACNPQQPSHTHPAPVVPAQRAQEAPYGPRRAREVQAYPQGLRTAQTGSQPHAGASRAQTPEPAADGRNDAARYFAWVRMVNRPETWAGIGKTQLRWQLSAFVLGMAGEFGSYGRNMRPGLDTMAAMLGTPDKPVSRNTVRDRLKQLEGLGLIRLAKEATHDTPRTWEIVPPA